MAGRVLIVPSSQADSCAQAVRAFLYPIGPRVHAVQAKLVKPDGVVCNTALWTVGNRELSGIAEEIAAWISTEADVSSGKPVTARNYQRSADVVAMRHGLGAFSNWPVLRLEAKRQRPRLANLKKKQRILDL